jgi:hypothetical protein
VSRFIIYRDLVLLHLGTFVVVYEMAWTPPPFDLTVGGLAAALLGVPLTQAADRARLSRKEPRA